MNIKELIIAFAASTLLTLLFFYKIFLGQIPIPSDLIAGGYYPWLDYKWGYQTGVPVKNPTTTDAVSVTFPLKTLAADLIKKGELPLWNPYMFGGYPLLASMPVGLFFPTFAFYFFLDNNTAWTLQIIFEPLMGLFFMYILARHLGLSKLSSFISGIVYAFSGFSMIWLEWNSQVNTSAILPILIFLEDKIIVSSGKNHLANPQLFWGLMFSLALAVQIFAGYPPIIIFSIYALILWYLIRDHTLSTLLKLAFFSFLGICLSAIFLLPSIELLQNSQRIFETLTPPEIYIPYLRLAAFFAPDFFGNPSSRNIWGTGDYTHMALYSGVTTLLLSIIAIRYSKARREVVYSITLLLLTLLIMFPNPVSIFLYNLGVFGGKSISLNRAIFLVNFSLAILAGFGLNQIVSNPKKISLKLILLIFSALIILLPGLTILLNLSPALENINTILKSLIIPIAVSVASILLLTVKLKFPIPKIEALFALLLIIELFRFGLKFNPFSPPKFLYPDTPVTLFLQNHAENRFLSEKDILPPNMWLPYKIESFAGYDSIYPLNIAKFIAVINSGSIATAPQTKNGEISDLNSNLINFTGTKYFLVFKRNAQMEIRPDGEISQKFKNPNLKVVFEDKSIVILENLSALPKAYLTEEVAKSEDNAILKNLMDSPPKARAYSEDFQYSLDYSRPANNRVEITVDTSKKAYLVNLETYFPGWSAKIDSSPVNLSRANFAFRGVVIPEGKHTVKLEYSPTSFYYGSLISFVSLISVLLLSLKIYVSSRARY